MSNGQNNNYSGYYKEIIYTEDEFLQYYKEAAASNENNNSITKSEEILKKDAMISMYIDKLCKEYNLEYDEFFAVWSSMDDNEFSEMLQKNEISSLNEMFN